ncbi:hypothetical protein BLA29_003927 [Euroglyphus maynei]|uniref:Uncharacterized protein n=1 Tax=Euroglyphus maynei TaxID=6958 RepID=A0A1Y3BL98_EURMA|nr:hypothetical protein BLA29_003927 [Euroglyphus maynei]
MLIKSNYGCSSNEMITNDMDNFRHNNSSDINYRKQLQQQQQREIVKNMKIKRSVSNFDSNYLNRIKWKNSGLNSLIDNDEDNPWRLKRSDNLLLEQYLSFEFLNERIHNRLQQEIECSPPPPNNTLRYMNFHNTSKSDSTKHDVHRNTQSSSDHSILMGKNLSCSEMNLSTVTKHFQQQHHGKTNPKTTVNKRKSFRKFIEHYFNGNNNNETMVSNDQPSLNGFDENFILKRNTPNAGLTDDERYKTFNFEHYREPINHGLRTWKKNRTTTATISSSLSTLDSCYYGTNSRTRSNVDKQLQMVANLFNNQLNNNGFEDTDYLSVSKHFIPNANPMMTDHLDNRLLFNHYLHQDNGHETSSTSNRIPDQPCFTLSNQLKTLLQNSNRLKNNYFYY